MAKRTGRIYSWPDGKLLASTGPFDNPGCRKGWVSVPLRQPVRTAPHQVYVMAIDQLEYYVKTAAFFKKSRVQGSVIALFDGAVYGFQSGQMPTGRTPETASSNYWVDGK